MSEQSKQLVKMDTEHLIRQVAVFSVFRPVLIALVGTALIVTGHWYTGVPLFLLGIIPLINALKWHGRVTEVFQRGRPLTMKVFFRKRNQLSPFSDLQASLEDQRGYDPFKQFFQLHWNLLGAKWDASKVLGDARECLVYLDRETGQVFAFSLEDGVLFVKPYILMPWRKLDVRALISSGKATDADLTR
ncbi:MAG: hypothetical protein C5B53_02845 [Candidatus Melainabacteria bacterium]|nr:MAG: hypothetical protein C5B53_02845 [Candidatus Melainabacteria bacterium]